MAGQQAYMAKSNVAFTKDNEYYTPKWIVDMFGVFDYDPATVKEKADEFEIKNYDTIKTNGLTTDWTQYKRIWCNPPFTHKHTFLQKAQETYEECGNDIYMLFPIEFMTTKRFHDIAKGGTVYVPNGRINFESGLGKKGKSPAFGSVVFKIGGEPKIEYIDIKNIERNK